MVKFSLFFPFAYKLPIIIIELFSRQSKLSLLELFPTCNVYLLFSKSFLFLSL